MAKLPKRGSALKSWVDQAERKFEALHERAEAKRRARVAEQARKGAAEPQDGREAVAR